MDDHQPVLEPKSHYVQESQTENRWTQSPAVKSDYQMIQMVRFRPSKIKDSNASPSCLTKPQKTRRNQNYEADFET